MNSHLSDSRFSTLFTKSLILLYFPKIEVSLFVCIELGQSKSLMILMRNTKVTAFDASHCPGNFSNILHTGDCGLTPECLQRLPEKFISKNGKQPRCQLDYVFLDRSLRLGDFLRNFQAGILQSNRLSIVWKHPTATRVYLTCDLLGQDDILVDVSRTFGSNILFKKLQIWNVSYL